MLAPGLVLLVAALQAAPVRPPATSTTGEGSKPQAVRPAPVDAGAAAAIAAQAMAAQKQGRLEEAATQYRRFLELVPRSWEVRSNLGVVCAQLGRYDEAVKEYRQALALQPAAQAVGAIRYNLAVALYKAGRMRDAAAELETLRKAQPDHPTATLLLADCRLQLGEWKQVIALLDPLLERDPENQAILYMIGTALMRDRQYQRGQAVLDRILRRGDSAEAHLVLAIASREANDDIAAEKELRRTLELNPNLPTANANLGEVLVKMGDAPGAAEALRRELAINPNHFDAHLLLALLLRQDSKNEESLQHVQKALALRPGDPGALYQLALLHMANLDYEAARRVLEPLVKQELSFTEAHVSLAMVYFRLGRREDGAREQAVVQRLKAEKQAREDAEKARLQGSTAPRP
jgi:Flp pilus assembly protein TadD